MGKIAKKLMYRKGGNAYNISLYNSTNDVGSSYITLRVDGALCYAQLASPGSESSTSVIVKVAGKKYAIRSKSEDLTMLSKGSSGGTGVVAPAPTGLWGYYWGVGQNVAATWYSRAYWTEPSDAQLVCEFTVSISKSITLSDVHHFRMKYSAHTLNCDIDAGTILAANNTWKIYVGPDAYFFRVFAEDASNNVLYSSPTYGPVYTPYGYKSTAGVAYHVDKSDSAGNGRVRVYDGNSPATVTGDYLNDANTKRWFYVASTTTAPWSGDSGVRWSGIACADTCSCNCNYCTCNCNYCTCNCNYCACDCNYSPCGCSSN